MSQSLRSRLLVRIAIATLVVLSTIAATTFVLVRKSLLQEFDSSLATKAHAMATLVEQDHDKLRIEFKDHKMQEFERDDRPEFYEVWNEDGTTIARSPHLGDIDLIANPISVSEPAFSFTRLPDGRPGRLVAVRFVPIIDDEVLLAAQKRAGNGSAADGSLPSARQLMTLALACDTEEIDEAVKRLAWMIFAASTAALALLLAALAWTVANALRPLKSLAAQIAGVDEHLLATRFDAKGAPSEIVPVVQRTNRLMRRLELAFLHERTFTADVAHELRTPLAGLRSTLQVTLSRTRDPVEYRQAMSECEDICANLQQLVETLLSLARLERDNSPEEWDYIDVGVLVENVWRPFDEPSRQRGLHVTRDGPENVFLRGHSDKMRVVLSNLFDNAVSHANPSGTIAISWEVSDDGLELKVANTGCRLTSGEIMRVFERFWRGDEARTETGVHAGLGLALCRKIVDTLNGSITAKCWGDTFEVTLAFGSESVEIASDSDAHAYC